MTDSSEKTLSLQPARSYQIPGGPLAKNLGEVNVKVLADIQRGSGDDRGYGNKR